MNISCWVQTQTALTPLQDEAAVCAAASQRLSEDLKESEQSNEKLQTLFKKNGQLLFSGLRSRPEQTHF